MSESVKCPVCLQEMDEHAADDGPVHVITGTYFTDHDKPGIRYSGLVHDRCVIVLSKGGKRNYEARMRMVEWSRDS